MSHRPAPGSPPRQGSAPTGPRRARGGGREVRQPIVRWQPLALARYTAARTLIGSLAHEGPVTSAARRLCGLLLGLAALAAAGSRSGASSPELLVTVGDVGPRSALLWLRATGTAPARLTLAAAGGRSSRELEATPDPAADFTARVKVDGLEPATPYRYRVRWQAEIVEGDFVTAPAPGVTAPVTLLWSGDLGGGGRCRPPGAGYPIFRAMAARRADLFVFVGDTVYADQRCPAPPSPEGADFEARDLAGFRARHRHQREDPGLARLLLGTSVTATWDDHEVRGDFAGPTEPLMPAGRQAFLEYWPVDPPPDEPTRLYRQLRWGRLLELFVLDTRQYRSPNAAPDGPGKTMLGPAQRAWLLDRVTRSGATWKLVVSSVPLSVGTGRRVRDGWANTLNPLVAEGDHTGFEHELLEIVHALAAGRLRNVVWLTADVHFPAVVRLAPLPGLVMHELIAGPLHARHGFPRWFDRTLNPTPLFAEGGYDNFGEIRADRTGLTVRIIDADGRERFATTLPPQPAP
jgi:alkaline phosphatase D